MALGVEIGTQVVVVFEEEVGLANANPEERGILGKEGINLLVAVGIDVGESVGVFLLLVNGCREETYVAEEVGIVDADEQTVETTHR